MLTVKRTDAAIEVRLEGVWNASSATRGEALLKNISLEGVKNVRIFLKDLHYIDTSGAWVLETFLKRLDEKSLFIQKDLESLDSILQRVRSIDIPPLFSERRRGWALTLLEGLGRIALLFFKNIKEFITFLGLFFIAFGHALRHPSRFRTASILHHIQRVGVEALPIVGLISFLMGVVLVYQGASQLRRFGAEIFTVDLLAVSLLREIAILLTAIVVAGRSGSSFTAQIGFMKLNQEMDAMQVMGLNVFDFLVIPRVVALIIALPLLSFFADMAGLLGGALMCSVFIDLTFDQFTHQLNLSLHPWTFWTGMIKAPFFAAIIGLIGCFEGMQVHGGAESVGHRTTRSVVEGIFFVISLDALFSIVFSYVGI